MPTILAALGAGLIFGLGLVVSHMANPAKVVNFLDVFGAWDPSLIFVMATAIPVAALGFAFARRRARPALAPEFQLPERTAIDLPLIGGATLFGIGWGLVGFCPGPALVAIGFGRREAVLVVAAMIAGVALVELVARLGGRRLSAA
jgi:uncharacterized protein